MASERLRVEVPEVHAPPPTSLDDEGPSAPLRVTLVAPHEAAAATLTAKAPTVPAARAGMQSPTAAARAGMQSPPMASAGSGGSPSAMRFPARASSARYLEVPGKSGTGSPPNGLSGSGGGSGGVGVGVGRRGVSPSGTSPRARRLLLNTAPADSPPGSHNGTAPTSPFLTHELVRLPLPVTDRFNLRIDTPLIPTARVTLGSPRGGGGTGSLRRSASCGELTSPSLQSSSSTSSSQAAGV